MDCTKDAGKAGESQMPGGSGVWVGSGTGAVAVGAEAAMLGRNTCWVDPGVADGGSPGVPPWQANNTNAASKSLILRKVGMLRLAPRVRPGLA